MAGAQNTAVDALFPGPSGPVRAETKTAAADHALLPVETMAADMQKRLAAIEARLGPASRPPSMTYNLERRLADLEKRVQQIEQQLVRMQQMDQRIRRLEMKQP